MPKKGLNERAAASASERLLPLWHMGEEASFFAGTLGIHERHVHSVPVLVSGLYDAFRLALEGAPPIAARAALIPPGRAYALDGYDSPIAVLYLEPARAGAEALQPLLHGAREEHGITLGERSEGPLRELFEDRNAARWVSAAVEDLLAFADNRTPRERDVRIGRVLTALAGDKDVQPVTLDASARAAGLSLSRFQHLFTREVGVPFRRYRIWQRLKAAIHEIARGETFASAAHGAGFSDQAHFSREFRRMFGAPPSLTLRQVRA